MKIVLMGVSGSGKSVVGTELGKQLKIPFFDADDFHSEANKAKMHAGTPLTDEDRKPWLETLAKLIRETPDLILACSALKASYRTLLNVSPEVTFIYLKGDYVLIKKRMENRKGHFFDPALLKSQFDTLEEPTGSLVVDISPPIDEIVSSIMRLLKK